MSTDPNLKFELTLRPDTIFLGSGGVEKWVSLVGGHTMTENTVAPKPQLRFDGIYFEGADTLGIASTPEDFNPGAGNFTFDWWQNQPSAAATATVAISANVGTYAGFQIYNNLLYMSNLAGSGWTINGMSIGSVDANTWTHHRVTKDSSNIVRSYKNGIYVAQSTLAHAMYYSNTLPSNIASNRGMYHWTGGLSDFRIYKSCLSYGESAFPPPPRSQVAIPIKPMPPIVVIPSNLIDQFDTGD